jgi:hypothetical protein
MTPILRNGHFLSTSSIPFPGRPGAAFSQLRVIMFLGVDSKIDDPIETDRTAEAEVSWLRAESQRKSKKMRLRCIFFDT